ncbi:carbohydrate ABC transporter permease [Candidatus Halobonum tyrrellensis]|uniref:Binding-protein-dependent transport systems inner membrane component n=1 Tax=Candidatus Halobonum tyrrellensis G22 TaxID=1324957 RepID=V4HPC6_9EURY|nr:sugar ABC transporter permease [Candidatus Halobonum tyrrellensis]ESP89779.1 binding-protein-dependent transport systems inner membrane component [Candidatus Halobonum tyrrellensis G22]
MSTPDGSVRASFRRAGSALRSTASRVVDRPSEENNLAGILFVVPNVVVFSVFLLGPILYAFVLSFQEWNLFLGTGEPAWTELFGVSLPVANYVDILQPWPWENNWASLRSPSFNLWWFAVRNTVLYTAVVVPVQIVGGFLVALALDGRIRGKKVYRAAYFLPVMLSAAASGVIWRWVLSKNGVLNEFLRPVGLAYGWANSPDTALGALMLIGLWGGIGFNMILYLAGLQNIPDELYEAARIDGADGLNRIRHVTWPNLRNTHFFVTVLAIIGTFQVFGIALAFAEGGPARATTTIVVLIYETAFARSSFGRATAMAFLLFAVVFVFSYYRYRIEQQEEVGY